MDLEINGLVFVLQSSPPKLIPGRIVEQIISRKIDGEHVKHVVQFSGVKTFVLEDIKKPWFPSLEKAEAYLKEEAEKLVSSVISDAVNTSEKIFGQQISVEESSPEAQLTSLDPEEVYVDMGNGQKAKVQLPEILKKKWKF